MPICRRVVHPTHTHNTVLSTNIRHNVLSMEFCIQLDIVCPPAGDCLTIAQSNLKFHFDTTNICLQLLRSSLLYHLLLLLLLLQRRRIITRRECGGRGRCRKPNREWLYGKQTDACVNPGTKCGCFIHDTPAGTWEWEGQRLNESEQAKGGHRRLSGGATQILNWKWKMAEFSVCQIWTLHSAVFWIIHSK